MWLLRKQRNFRYWKKLRRKKSYPQNVITVNNLRNMLYQENNFTQNVEFPCGYVNKFCG